jgi:signal transduction histidine kinase
LFVEATERDTELSLRELRDTGFLPTWQRVDDAAGLRTALQQRSWDVVICDSNNLQLGAFEALWVTRELAPDTPFIVLFESLREDAAVDIVRSGATNVVTKENFKRLGPVVIRELARRTTEAPTPGIARLLIAAQEKEARRIAREVHDQLGQLLVGLAQMLEAAQEDGISRAIYLQKARAIAGEALRTARELSTELWPSVLADLGLVAALRWLADRHIGRHGGKASVEADAFERNDDDVEVALFRIAEQALTNVGRHAGAHAIAIQLRKHADTLELVVRDDGRGFDPDAAWQGVLRGASLGLLAMRERATLIGGTLTIASAAGVGTIVRVDVPVRR